MKKYLFLDMDGVLNTFRTLVAFGQGAWPGEVNSVKLLDPIGLRMLRMVHAQGVDFVLSSTWRSDYATPARLKKFSGEMGIEFIGITGDEYILNDNGVFQNHRGNQIKQWLDKNAPNDEEFLYCILDDDSDMFPEQFDSFVKTQYSDGYSMSCHKKVCKILQVSEFQRTSPGGVIY